MHLNFGWVAPYITPSPLYIGDSVAMAAAEKQDVQPKLNTKPNFNEIGSNDKGRVQENTSNINDGIRRLDKLSIPSKIPSGYLLPSEMQKGRFSIQPKPPSYGNSNVNINNSTVRGNTGISIGN